VQHTFTVTDDQLRNLVGIVRRECFAGGISYRERVAATELYRVLVGGDPPIVPEPDEEKELSRAFLYYWRA
jgi:hypothetical protein